MVKDAFPDVNQLALSPTTDYSITQMRLGKASLEFNSSRFNALNKIPILVISKAGCSINSFTMVYGKVLHNYLNKE